MYLPRQLFCPYFPQYICDVVRPETMKYKIYDTYIQLHCKTSKFTRNIQNMSTLHTIIIFILLLFA